jgi:hypothetical protein
MSKKESDSVLAAMLWRVKSASGEDLPCNQGVVGSYRTASTGWNQTATSSHDLPKSHFGAIHRN